MRLGRRFEYRNQSVTWSGNFAYIRWNVNWNRNQCRALLSARKFIATTRYEKFTAEPIFTDIVSRHWLIRFGGFTKDRKRPRYLEISARSRIFYAKSSSITCTYRRRHYRSDTITSFQDVSRCFCFLKGRDIFIRSKRRTVWKFMEEKDGRREWQAKCFDEFVYFKKVSRNVWTMKYDETPLKRNVDSAKESKKKIG